MRFAMGAMVLALAASAVSAQPSAPATGVTSEQRDAFRICRAAVFYHLDPEARRQTLPAAVAETMRRQIAFIMHETLRSAPSRSVREAEDAIDFAENFFLSFSMTLREQARLATDVAAREAILIDCIPMLWTIVAGHIDPLLARREMAGR